MAFTPVEIIALILILVTFIKVIVIAINPQAWNNNVVKKVFKGTKSISIIFFILALIILRYLLQEITIVQIIATIAFVSLLMGLGFMSYSQDLQKFVDKIYKQKNILRRAWFYTLIWIILLLWGLKEILF